MTPRQEVATLGKQSTYHLLAKLRVHVEDGLHRLAADNTEDRGRGILHAVHEHRIGKRGPRRWRQLEAVAELGCEIILPQVARCVHLWLLENVGERGG